MRGGKVKDEQNSLSLPDANKKIAESEKKTGHVKGENIIL